MNDGGEPGEHVAGSGEQEIAKVATILDGRRLADQLFKEVRADLAAFRTVHGAVPAVAVVRVGEDPASRVYARQIRRSAEHVGAPLRLVEYASDTSIDELRAAVARLSADDTVGGIIFQLPLPAHLPMRRIVDALDPMKDIDGVHPLNAGLVARGEAGFAPSCPEAALVTLKRHGIPLAGRPTVVVGRSNVVGRPAQLLLLGEHATVTVCHRQTRDLDAELRRAEVVVVAAGAPGLIRGEALSPGVIVIDCGINVRADGSLVGDVDLPSVLPIAGAVTPVPGGIGPVTNAVLMMHLARALRAQRQGSLSDTLEEVHAYDDAQ